MYFSRIERGKEGKRDELVVVQLFPASQHNSIPIIIEYLCMCFVEYVKYLVGGYLEVLLRSKYPRYLTNNK